MPVQGVITERSSVLPPGAASGELKGVTLDCGYVMDLLVEDVVVIELKAVEQILPIHEAQLLTYLKLSGKRVGLLINFKVPPLKRGIVRRIL
ncbi:MAG: GxxExxY protein [Burkholderiales bacterium]